jgi:hypothetical protein
MVGRNIATNGSVLLAGGIIALCQPEPKLNQCFIADVYLPMFNSGMSAGTEAEQRYNC